MEDHVNINTIDSRTPLDIAEVSLYGPKDPQNDVIPTRIFDLIVSTPEAEEVRVSMHRVALARASNSIQLPNTLKLSRAMRLRWELDVPLLNGPPVTPLLKCIPKRISRGFSDTLMRAHGKMKARQRPLEIALGDYLPTSAMQEKPSSPSSGNSLTNFINNARAIADEAAAFFEEIGNRIYETVTSFQPPTPDSTYDLLATQHLETDFTNRILSTTESIRHRYRALSANGYNARDIVRILIAAKARTKLPTQPSSILSAPVVQNTIIPEDALPYTLKRVSEETFVVDDRTLRFIVSASKALRFVTQAHLGSYVDMWDEMVRCIDKAAVLSGSEEAPEIPVEERGIGDLLGETAAFNYLHLSRRLLGDNLPMLPHHLINAGDPEYSLYIGNPTAGIIPGEEAQRRAPVVPLSVIVASSAVDEDPDDIAVDIVFPAANISWDKSVMREDPRSREGAAFLTTRYCGTRTTAHTISEFFSGSPIEDDDRIKYMANERADFVAQASRSYMMKVAPSDALGILDVCSGSRSRIRSQVSESAPTWFGTPWDHDADSRMEDVEKLSGWYPETCEKAFFYNALHIGWTSRWWGPTPVPDAVKERTVMVGCSDFARESIPELQLGLSGKSSGFIDWSFGANIGTKGPRLLREILLHATTSDKYYQMADLPLEESSAVHEQGPYDNVLQTMKKFHTYVRMTREACPVSAGRDSAYAKYIFAVTANYLAMCSEERDLGSPKHRMLHHLNVANLRRVADSSISPLMDQTAHRLGISPDATTESTTLASLTGIEAYFALLFISTLRMERHDTENNMWHDLNFIPTMSENESHLCYKSTSQRATQRWHPSPMEDESVALIWLLTRLEGQAEDDITCDYLSLLNPLPVRKPDAAPFRGADGPAVTAYPICI